MGGNFPTTSRIRLIRYDFMRAWSLPRCVGESWFNSIYYSNSYFFNETICTLFLYFCFELYIIRLVPYHWSNFSGKLFNVHYNRVYDDKERVIRGSLTCQCKICTCFDQIWLTSLVDCINFSSQMNMSQTIF